jgi:hypothetical protein
MHISPGLLATLNSVKSISASASTKSSNQWTICISTANSFLSMTNSRIKRYKT